MVKTLVITSCTGNKKIKLKNQLSIEDFKKPDQLKHKEKKLRLFSISAAEMYTGMQHLRLMEGVSILRSAYGDDIIDVNIVSAGYGLLPANRSILPYEVTFNTMSNKQIIEWSRFLNIHNNLQKLIQNYDLIFFLLGDKYLRALELPLNRIAKNKKIIFLASKTNRKLIPLRKGYYFLETGKKEASSFGYPLVGLKGYLFKLFTQEVIKKEKGLFDKIHEEPRLFFETINKYRKAGLEIIE